jgi:gas vesicle protein
VENQNSRIMSNRDGFSSGFWLGTLVGGVVGGIVGASIATQRANRINDELDGGKLSSDGRSKRQFKSSRRGTFDRGEIARRSLDDKIEDLNNAIDSVRSSIAHVPVDEIDRTDERVKVQKPNGFSQISNPDIKAE